jgi:hypothetical protein
MVSKNKQPSEFPMRERKGNNKMEGKNVKQQILGQTENTEKAAERRKEK